MALYDNAHLPNDTGFIPPFDPSFGALASQPFFTQDNATISSARVVMERVGSRSGLLHLDVWSDNGAGKPAERIARLGSNDISSIGTAEDVFALEGLSLALAPNTLYHLVIDPTDLSVSDAANSFRASFRTSNDGTFGAGKFLVEHNSNWLEFDSLVPGLSYLRMSVTAELSGEAGDFDRDGSLTVLDIDRLVERIAAPDFDATFDLNNDGKVTRTDLNTWVKDLKKTWIGDANLDGEFNSNDLVEVFQAGKYETGEVVVWSQGDWNSDHVFDSSDLIAAFQDGGYEAGPRATAVAVPEPACGSLLMIGIIGLYRLRPPRQNEFK